MKTSFLIIFLTLILITLACGTSTPRPPLEPVPDISTSLAPVPGSSPQIIPEPQQEPSPAPTITSPSQSGLRIVYVRDGNLWSWTEAGGSVQLTGTGDMSTVCLSGDGQLLAFMRGHEVWTVRMDGTDARLIQTLENTGAALWFAPNDSLLAISTKEQIIVADLSDNSSSTVVTYPAIPDGNYPEVVWSPDVSGFKTVVPPQTESGQAELMFVFTDGTVASLARFSMLLPSESAPYISPDGGYLIYVAKLDGNKESLYLMDSSGARKPYGTPGDALRAYGWLPDSQQFTFGDRSSQKVFLGSIGGPAVQITFPHFSLVRWVDADRFLALDEGDLTLGDMSGGMVLIDSGVQGFDFQH